MNKLSFVIVMIFVFPNLMCVSPPGSLVRSPPMRDNADGAVTAETPPGPHCRSLGGGVRLDRAFIGTTFSWSVFGC